MSKGFALIVSSLHHDPSGHLRVNRAKVRITSRLAEGERELLIGVEYFGLEHTLGADNLWGMSSRLVHVTVVPTGTVSVPGPKLKLSIFTSVVSSFCCALAEKVPVPAPGPAIPNPNATNKTAVDTLLLMALLLFLFVLGLLKILDCV